MTLLSPIRAEAPVRQEAQVALSVVVPAFNEETRLGPTLKSMLQWCESAGINAEILVVDDGSRDRTLAVAQECARSDRRIRPLGYPKNRGKGYAVKMGILASRGAEILFSDADLSTPMDEYDALHRKLAEGWEIAIGSRHLATSQILVRQPFHRRYLGRVFNGVVALLGIRGVADTQCGFKLFRRSAAMHIFSRLRTEGFAFDVEILLRARASGMKVAEVPVRWANSSSSRVRPLRDAFRMLIEILRMRGIL